MYRCLSEVSGTSGYFLKSLIRGRNGFGFLHLHLFAAAGKFAFSGFGAERFGVAFGAAIPFSYLIRHILSPLRENLSIYYYRSKAQLLSKLRLFYLVSCIPLSNP